MQIVTIGPYKENVLDAIHEEVFHDPGEKDFAYKKVASFSLPLSRATLKLAALPS